MIKSKENFYIPNTEIWTCPSKDNRLYKIFVYIPNTPTPQNGFPVIYLLDGNANFGSFVENIRLQTKTSAKTGMHPAVLIGIGYETTEPYSTERYLDFTFDSDQKNFLKTPKELNGLPMVAAKIFYSFWRKN